MAPEILLDGRVSKAADMYAFGERLGCLPSFFIYLHSGGDTNGSNDAHYHATTTAGRPAFSFQVCLSWCF